MMMDRRRIDAGRVASGIAPKSIQDSAAPWPTSDARLWIAAVRHDKKVFAGASAHPAGAQGKWGQGPGGSAIHPTGRCV